MNDERRPEGGARTSRRLHPNSAPRRYYPRCPECGTRAPTTELLTRHQERDCHGLHGVQLNLDDALVEQVEGFDDWSVFNDELADGWRSS